VHFSSHQIEFKNCQEGAMIRYPFWLTLCFCLCAGPASAVEIAVAGKLVLDIELSPGWTLHIEPPEALVDELAIHVAHDTAAAGATEEQIKAVSRMRLAANEAFLFHEVSGAHLDIDFSSLAPGEPEPDARSLYRSAEAAVQSLEHEDDVSELFWDIVPAKMTGVSETFLLSAGYLQHERPMIFLGYVGYVEKYWFFLYFTASGDAPEVRQEIQSMLARATIRSTSH
jgi:hypothetical protein